MQPSHRSSRLAALVSASLLVGGSLLFVAGGSQHPSAATAFGVVGTEAFYRAFASHVHHQSNWVPIHVLILLGPVCWALAVPGLTPAAPPNESAEPGVDATLRALASRSLLFGAVLWTVAFVLDGFVAPATAGAIASAAPADVAGMLVTFRVHQVTMVRLGLIAWILIGLAMMLHGVAMLLWARLASMRAMLGAAGVLIGLWPMVATATGEFDPGPFTSALWMPTALATALWFAAFGVSLLVRGRAPAARAATGTSPGASSELTLQH